MLSRSCREDDDINPRIRSLIDLRERILCLYIAFYLKSEFARCKAELRPDRCKEETQARQALRRDSSPPGVPADLQSAGTPSGLAFLLFPPSGLAYLKPQSFLRASASWFSTSFSISSGRLQKKSMPVLFSSVLMFTTYLPSLSPFSNALFS